MCDTIVIVRPDRVWFAKNSDRDVNEAQLISWHPAAEHAEGDELQCTYLRIPQARRTHAVMLSRPFWMWGAEIGTNEHGVAIGNEAVFTDQPYAKTGLTGMDLLRLALERSETAEEAVDIIRALLEEHGQGGGCGHENRSFTYHNSFLVADPNEAYVLETAGNSSGVERVEGARTISNCLTIPEFAASHPERLKIKTHFSRARIRRSRTQELAEAAEGPGDLMRLLRDHGADRDAPSWSFLTGCMDAPCMHAGGIAANSQTTASWVAELKPGEHRHWVTATAAPCTGLFKPVRVDEPLDLSPEPTDRADSATLWWRHERLHRAVMTDYARLAPPIQAERDEIEAGWLAEPPEPRVAFAEADELLDGWTKRVLAAVERDKRPYWARRFWRVRSRRAASLQYS